METARKLIAERALHRTIVAVDDTDSYVCRPHAPGQIRDALLGRQLIAAHRRGKTMWCETSGLVRRARFRRARFRRARFRRARA